jgi:nitrogen fixation protein NifU and related proteins
MLEELYQEIILDHYKRPRNYRVMEEPSCSAEGLNPLCGDEISVYIKLDGDRIQDISFQGQGCALSKASASLMSLRLQHKTISESQAEVEAICQLLTQEEEPPSSALDALGDLSALAAVRKFPARIKCATLAWHALKEA